MELIVCVGDVTAFAFFSMGLEIHLYSAQNPYKLGKSNSISIPFWLLNIIRI